MGFAIVVAINQLGIAANLVNILFVGVVGAISLSLGLAFGLGGRETAAKVVDRWYERSREAAPTIRRAVEAARPATHQGNGRASEPTERIDQT